MTARRDIEITSVIQPPLDKHQCWGGFLDAPRADSHFAGYAIPIEGWVFGRRTPAVAIEIVHRGAAVYRAPIDLRRPDIVAAFPGVDGGERTGFRLALSSLRLPREFELQVHAVLADDERVCIAEVRGRRPALPADGGESMRPLLLTTLGRTGSTWLSMLLSQHPQIVCYRPLRYEPRVTSYWVDVLQTLAEPRSYLQTIRGDLTGEHWWIGDKRISPLPPPLVDHDVQVWLARDHVDGLIAFCRGRIDALYAQIARSQGLTSPRYFAEKVWPNDAFIELLMELYPDLRETLLVRDFRDMACSIFAFNQRVGRDSFGRERVDSDADFLRELRTGASRMRERWRMHDERSTLVRYEDLIQRPEASLRGLFDHLGVDRDETTIRGVIDRARSSMVVEQRQHQTSADAAGSIGRWRRDLSAEMQAVCHDALGDLLREFGYDAP